MMTTDQKYDCVFCQENFDDKETLQIHFRKHGDPMFDIGTKAVKSRIQNESTSAAVEKVGDEVEMVGCDVCEEVFPTISKAITHKHKAHPNHDAKYFCPFCGKLFTMKHLLNKHVQGNHNSEEVSTSKDFHCDMCDVTFNMPSAMLYHNKFFHRQDTDIPVIGISKKIKLFNQEMLQIYYCSFCGEEYHNKINLHKHICDDHSEENQSPSEVLRCPLCEAVFYHLDAYEIHLTFHSPDDMYNEKNELVDQVTEFSLETVAPIMEHVEEEEPVSQPEDDNINSDVVNNFLQLVMQDQGDTVTKTKHKKHKKHKKSKKASITLDEFLNMNKDVFGDGIGDVQGIEEVPTQVVLKKVKGKAKTVNADLAKLKKHGIVVKAKSKFTNPITSLNQHSSKAKQITNVKNNPNIIQKSPNDIISKLLNQGNSQIKIVKKSASQNFDNEYENSDTTVANANECNEQDSTPNRLAENCKSINKMSNDLNTFSVSCNPSEYTELTFTTNEIRNKSQTEIPRNIDFNGKDKTTDTHGSECILANEEVSNNMDETTIPSDSKTNLHDDKLASSSQERVESIQSDLKNENEDNNENCDKHDGQDCGTSNVNETLNVLKHLSHLITVKPLANQNRSPINEEIKSESFDSNQEIQESSKNINVDENIPLKSLSQSTLKKPTPSLLTTSPSAHHDSECVDKMSNFEKNNDNLKLEMKNIIPMKHLQVRLVKLTQTICDKYLSKEDDEKSSDFITEEKTINDKVQNSKNTSNLDIIKRLSNVTAKPVNVGKIANQQPPVKPYQPNVPQIKSLQPKIMSKNIDDEIEVFNIDDSDEETEQNTVTNFSETKPSSGVPADIIKNQSRNVIFKSSETHKTIPNKKNSHQSSITRLDSFSESYSQMKQSKEIQKSINLQNKLKTLGNITVKSNMPSPKVFNQDFDDYEDQGGSDSDNEIIGGVKISEIKDDYAGDSDLNDVNPNAIVESPNASNSENEDNQNDFEDDFPDIESHIKLNTVKKTEAPLFKKPIHNLDNLKHLNKALTIKSINTKTTNPVLNKEVADEANKPIQEMAVKLYKPNISQNELPFSKNIPQASGSSNHTLSNQKVNSASNQINTVKTVNTVKRFQSQTVIEEITTTVTKTIRTVNSSTNEVMQSTSQNTPKPINKPQKIINKQGGRELQGTGVRHVSPTIGTKIRNAVPLARAPNANIVRPTNQLVSLRPPLFNRPRCPIPSTAAVRKMVPPNSSPQKHPIGKLKISPHALNQSSKRPSDEAVGYTFKKPNNNSQDHSDDESTMQYTSTQSRSDFSSFTKKAKGMVTATQARSEVSTSSQQQVSKGMGTAIQMRSEVSMTSHQQLSRLNNMSGLKVLKTSSKQVTQVEENCELSPGKRNTLEAIEKLQRQGLLVKKPRIEEQGNPFSESDEEFGEN